MTRHDLQWIRKLNISESVLITVYLLTAVPCPAFMIDGLWSLPTCGT